MARFKEKIRIIMLRGLDFFYPPDVVCNAIPSSKGRETKQRSVNSQTSNKKEGSTHFIIHLLNIKFYGSIIDKISLICRKSLFSCRFFPPKNPNFFKPIFLAFQEAPNVRSMHINKKKRYDKTDNNQRRIDLSARNPIHN